MKPNEPSNLPPQQPAANDDAKDVQSPLTTPSSNEDPPTSTVSSTTPPTNNTAPVAPQAQPSKFDPKNLFQQWQFWGMVAMGFIAIIGIIFGVYGFNSDAEQRDRADQLQAELDEANELLVKYGTQLGIKVNEYGRPTGETSDDNKKDEPAEVKIASSDYIYIGEWEIKLKIPEGLTKVSYVFDGADWKGITSIAVAGLPEDLDFYPDEAGEMPGFADMRGVADSNNYAGLGVLSRYPLTDVKDTSGSCPDNYMGNTLAYSDAKYCYFYSHPQSVFSTDETEQAAELKTVELVQELLTKNITTF